MTATDEEGAANRFLTEQECHALLAARSVGRVNFTRHAMTTPVTVRYTVDGDDLVLEPEAGSGLVTILDATMVEFEVETADRPTGAARRVVVVGDASTSAAPGDRQVRIRPSSITGHRLPPHHVAC